MKYIWGLYMSGKSKGVSLMVLIIIVALMLVIITVFLNTMNISGSNELVSIKGKTNLYLETVESGSAASAFLNSKIGPYTFMDSVAILSSNADETLKNELIQPMSDTLKNIAREEKKSYYLSIKDPNGNIIYESNTGKPPEIGEIPLYGDLDLVWPADGQRIGSGFGWRVLYLKETCKDCSVNNGKENECNSCNTCYFSSGNCVQKKPNEDACKLNSECLSNWCYSGQCSGGNDFHGGIDISGRDGIDPIYSASDGEVIKVERDPDANKAGKYVKVRHTSVSGATFEFLYGHMHSIIVNEGQKVNKGDKLGLIGATGGVTGPHLHFEIRIDKNEDGIYKSDEDSIPVCPYYRNPENCMKFCTDLTDKSNCGEADSYVYSDFSVDQAIVSVPLMDGDEAMMELILWD